PIPSHTGAKNARPLPIAAWPAFQRKLLLKPTVYAQRQDPLMKTALPHQTSHAAKRMRKKKPMKAFSFGPRRGVFVNIASHLRKNGDPLDQAMVEICYTCDLSCRTRCAVMYQIAPLSGHP